MVFHSVWKQPDPEVTVTDSFGRFLAEVKPYHLTPVTVERSKRMVLDSIGVGLIGSRTAVFELALQHCQVSGVQRENTPFFHHFSTLIRSR